MVIGRTKCKICIHQYTFADSDSDNNIEELTTMRWWRLVYIHSHLTSVFNHLAGPWSEV